MPKLLTTIEDCPVTIEDDGSVTYTAKAAIDDDGAGTNVFHDPDFQPGTTLRVNGRSLDAETDQYIVVPPAIIDGVAPEVLGCAAIVSYVGRSIRAVVGDRGPHAKLGEISVAAAKALGIPDSGIDGGIDAHVVSYQIFPGRPAVVNGKTYPLQRS